MVSEPRLRTPKPPPDTAAEPPYPKLVLGSALSADVSQKKASYDLFNLAPGRPVQPLHASLNFESGVRWSLVNGSIAESLARYGGSYVCTAASSPGPGT